MRLDFDSQGKSVRVYDYCYRTLDTPDSEWSDRLTTTSSRGNIIAPLNVAQLYEFKVRAVNSKGPGDWSQTVSILVR
ncbi:fibronectin type III domain-containing protein [Sphingobacterium sp.]|uniref:fibronectin type III domain-containing protein n=1 Tax=Sphingobacterium sp. TaxID=341027 RepID=UPI00289DB91B|nr:fibronectin type III domain-containing protein [Sphingobacterium sp.]